MCKLGMKSVLYVKRLGEHTFDAGWTCIAAALAVAVSAAAEIDSTP